MIWVCRVVTAGQGWAPEVAVVYSLTQVRVVITTSFIFAGKGMRGHLGVCIRARLQVDLFSTLALPLQEVSTHQNHS